jgi:hypothetical protein
MDHFMEEIVVKKQKGFNEVLYYLSLVMMVLFGIIAMFMFSSIFMQFDIPTLIILVLSAGSCALIFLRRDRLRTDYEYTFTNGDMDFAMVFNNQKRKNLGTMKVKNVEAFGPVSGSAFGRYVSMQGVKTSNWFLNRGAELYFFYFVKENSKRLIVIEPSPEMVEYIKKYIPRGAWQA